MWPLRPARRPEALQALSAHRVFAEQNIDLVLMDIKMPEIDGHQLSQMLQKSRSLKNIPIVMLTAEDGMVSRLQSKLSGASYYLKKPCNVDELVKVVKRFTSNELDNSVN